MIVFAWDGFPQYAARCVGALVRSTDERVVVLATRPIVPIDGMEKVCGCPVIWIDANETRSLAEVLSPFQLQTPNAKLPTPNAKLQTSNAKLPTSNFKLQTPDARLRLLVSGWSIPAFNRFRDEVHAQGGSCVAMLDNNFCLRGMRAIVRESLKALKFRLKTKRLFDGYFVPGKASRKLMRFYGVSEDKIATGVYAADDQLFCAGEALSRREKKIIYVGQFIERKNVMRMCRAFLSAGGTKKDWTLELYGSGPLRDELRALTENRSQTSIRVYDFLQPEELAAKYRAARVFCLPSLEEHWGLVVHEAALSGCLLMLSDRVGARDDFQGESNIEAFDPYDEQEMANAFRRVFALSDAALDAAGAESVRLGHQGASIAKFVEAVKRGRPLSR